MVFQVYLGDHPAAPSVQNFTTNSECSREGSRNLPELPASTWRRFRKKCHCCAVQLAMAEFLWVRTSGIRESTWHPPHRLRGCNTRETWQGRGKREAHSRSWGNTFLWHTSCLLWHHQGKGESQWGPGHQSQRHLKCPNSTLLFIKAQSQLWAATASGAGKHWGKEAWDGLTLEWKLIHQVSFLTFLPKAGQSFIQVKPFEWQFPSKTFFHNFWSAAVESQIPSFQFLFTPQPAPSLGSKTNISVIPEGAPGLSHCRQVMEKDSL